MDRLQHRHRSRPGIDRARQTIVALGMSPTTAARQASVCRTAYNSEMLRWGKVVKRSRPCRLAIGVSREKPIRASPIRHLASMLVRSRRQDAGWSARAQDYPSRQVTLVLPFAPGGAIDIFARSFAQKLSDKFGKPFVVENRPGAGTVVAAHSVARAAVDGHTVLVSPSRSRSTRRSTRSCPTTPRTTSPRSPMSPTSRWCWWCTRRCRCSRSQT